MKKKILIVDDEPQIREIFKEVFETADYNVHEAKNGREAFRLTQEILYDIVLSDVRMPGGDGLELAKNIHELSGPKPKVFLITGCSDSLLENAKEWGVIKVFDKPFDFKEVLKQVHAASSALHGDSLV